MSQNGQVRRPFEPDPGRTGVGMVAVEPKISAPPYSSLWIVTFALRRYRDRRDCLAEEARHEPCHPNA